MLSLHHVLLALLLGPLDVLATAIPTIYSSEDRPTELTTHFLPPSVDPFYSVPANISRYSPGEIVRSRAIASTIFGAAVKSYQVYYRSNDQKEDAIGSVATIWEPAIPAFPPKIFSYQIAEDGLNIDCSPSYGWVSTTAGNEPLQQSEGGIVVKFALSQGWYVVNSDFEGPNSAWLVGLLSGHLVLDAIRSTINYMDLPCERTEAVLYGYSGGAAGTVWGATVAEAYAPELNIVGAAHGGTPVDLQATYDLVNGHAWAFVGGDALVGLANGYPKFNATLNSISTANGTKTRSIQRLPEFCFGKVQREYACFNFSTLFTESLSSNPEITGVLAKNSLLFNVSPVAVPVPRFPRFEWHGTKDITVPYPAEAEYVKQQCAKGADIRFLTLPGLTHVPGFYSGMPGALEFLYKAFNKELGHAECGANVTVPAIGSLEAIALLGVEANYALAAVVAEQLATPVPDC